MEPLGKEFADHVSEWKCKQNLMCCNNRQPEMNGG